jgi:hypothetical protein
MKKRHFLIALLALSPLFARPQAQDSTYQKTRVDKTEVEVLYSHYLQDGNNSAVTGGVGTEKLSVYAPSIRIKNTRNMRTRYGFKGGVDLVTSASTDKIDFVKTSASYFDQRIYFNLSGARRLKAHNLWIGGSAGFSAESDYTSLNFNPVVEYAQPDGMRSYSFDLQVFLDDLRWGRFDEGIGPPKRLTLPKELRGQDLYDDPLRQSYNFKFALTQVLNKRNILAIYPEFALQHGLLATTFHRIYFADSTLTSEQLPDRRLKFALGIQENSFVGGRTIFKNRVDVYADDFGVLAAGLETEIAFKVNSQWSISPFGRAYVQSASTYFAPKYTHLPTETYYTSDYDLSQFFAYKLGLGIRYSPYKYVRKRLIFQEIQLRYAYYHRSTPLNAHVLTCVLNLGREKTRMPGELKPKYLRKLNP